jgi:hypothetical protein
VENALEPTVDLSPDPEALERLLQLVSRLAVIRASKLPARTVSEAHEASHGHPLRFGCCSSS